MVYTVQAPTATRTGKYRVDEKGDLRDLQRTPLFLGSEAFDISTGKTYYLTGTALTDWVEATTTAVTYALTETETNCTITTKVGNSTVSPASGALTSGDVVTVTVAPSAHYHMNTFTYNGASITTPYTAMIKEDVTVVGSASIDTYNLETVSDSHGTITVARGEDTLTDGDDVLAYGDVLTITYTPGTGYNAATLTVNEEAFTSGETHTVAADVAVVGTTVLKTYNLAVTATDCTVTVLNGETPVEAGTGVLTHFDVLTISVVPGDGKTMSVFTVNAEAFTSGETHEVTGAVTIVATATA